MKPTLLLLTLCLCVGCEKPKSDNPIQPIPIAASIPSNPPPDYLVMCGDNGQFSFGKKREDGNVYVYGNGVLNGSYWRFADSNEAYVKMWDYYKWSTNDDANPPPRPPIVRWGDCSIPVPDKYGTIYLAGNRDTNDPPLDYVAFTNEMAALKEKVKGIFTNHYMTNPASLKTNYATGLLTNDTYGTAMLLITNCHDAIKWHLDWKPDYIYRFETLEGGTMFDCLGFYGATNINQVHLETKYKPIVTQTNGHWEVRFK